MFFFRKLFGLFFVGLLIFGLFGFIGRGRHGRTQSAYQQGFFDGQQAAAVNSEKGVESSEGTSTTAPVGTSGTQVYYRGHDFFFPGSVFLFCLMPLFFAGMLFMLFGKRRWHGQYAHHGRWGHHKGGRGPWGPGPCGPRQDRQDDAKEKSPEDIDDGPDGPVMRA